MLEKCSQHLAHGTDVSYFKHLFVDACNGCVFVLDDCIRSTDRQIEHLNFKNKLRCSHTLPPDGMTIDTANGPKKALLLFVILNRQLHSFQKPLYILWTQQTGFLQVRHFFLRNNNL